LYSTASVHGDVAPLTTACAAAAAASTLAYRSLSALQLTFTKPHILLLDEPSNHLDIDAVDALIQGLAVFKGGVLMVRVPL
jgi:ATP-binding cassette subfamily F protein 3